MANTITTPTGSAVWPHLVRPQMNFDPATYQVTLVLDQKDADTLIEQITAAVEAARPSIEATARRKGLALESIPWGPHVDRDKQPIAGKVAFKFKQQKTCGSGEKQWTFTPKIFNPDLSAYDGDEEIGYNSKLRICFEPHTWFVQGKLGVTLRLKAVQVVEFAVRGAESYGFDPVEVEMNTRFKPVAIAPEVRRALVDDAESFALSDAEFLRDLKGLSAK